MVFQVDTSMGPSLLTFYFDRNFEYFSLFAFDLHFEILSSQVDPTTKKQERKEVDFIPWLTMMILHLSMVKCNFEQTYLSEWFFTLIFFALLNLKINLKTRVDIVVCSYDPNFRSSLRVVFDGSNFTLKILPHLPLDQF